MKSFRIPFFPLLILLLCAAAFPARFNARQTNLNTDAGNFNLIFYSPSIFSDSGFASAINDYYRLPDKNSETKIVKRPDNGGIKEIIPGKFQEKYAKWKDELLSTEIGRRQWESYAGNKHFILTITVDSQEKEGAGTGKYQWDETGELVGATITLGNKLDKGLPNPIYFPVMNALSSDEPFYRIGGDILAAAKFAHEFGHVNQTAKMKGDFFQLQNKLMPVYNEILLKNGYNVRDRTLVDLARQMGGTPVEIWENREYWGEANAMLYVADKINKESYYCSIYGKMKRNIELYAKEYEARFDQIAEAKNFESVCGR